VESREENRFTPLVSDYLAEGGAARRLVLLSNPCNPTGITREGADLESLVHAASSDGTGVLIDEAYELFHEPPVSALRYVEHLDDSNLFVVGAATKGLQAPGIRIGWVVAARRHIEVLGNFSSFGMGGVSHPSQCFAVELLRADRLAQARTAVPAFYASQRARYGEAFTRLGLDLFTGAGGFYHWCRLPSGLTAQALNERLFPRGAAILKGTDCDMRRRGDSSPLRSFFRFSFGPLDPASFESDIAILSDALLES
jgi:aspartate/methionine/tyrosine aminotransferase